MPHRFGREELVGLAEGAGLGEVEVRGVRVFADLVPSGLVDADPRVAEALVALEEAASTHPVLAELATQLHLRARRV